MAIKKGKSDNFYAKLHQLARENQFPLKAMFELTYKCNFKCIHCYVVTDKTKKELNTIEVKKVLDQLKAAGCFHVGFTGGEIFTRKDIFEILDYAKGLGFRISLLTNGFLIDKKTAKKIASLGTNLNRVDISVLGATMETFEKITRQPGSFEKVMRAIKFLKDAGVTVQLKATLMEANKNEFIKIKQLAEKFDTLFRYSPTINPLVNGDEKVLQYQVQAEEVYALKEKLSKAKRVVNESDFEGWDPKATGRKRVFRCGAGQTEISISPYGEMNLCLEIHYPEYNILKGSFKKGWKKIKKIVKNLKLPKNYLCGDCVLASFCRWCPARGGKKLANCSQKDREMALVDAQHSSLWGKISPCWEKQKGQFKTCL